ncbi:hypothetical protein P4594_25265 [Priestia megaterium]|uniref:DUF7380 domain-containing protein n=1 Tax=Priestia megaterium TaxID=1404 RepID=UPI002E1ED658|nr:hypothetical protein [Priestia megaterium]
MEEFMSILTLKKEDFSRIDWGKILNSHSLIENRDYSKKFYEEMDQFEESGNKKQKLLYKLFGDITSYYLDLDSKDNPYKPFVYRDKRTASIEDLTASDLSFLDSIVKEIPNSEIKARIADVLWLRLRNSNFIELAIGTYIDAYHQFLNHKSGLHPAIDRLERAVQLATLFRSGEIREQFVKKIEEEINKYKEEAPSFLLFRLLQLLLNIKKVNLTAEATLLKGIALLAESKKDWHIAREYWNLCAEYYKKEKDFLERDSAKKASANTFVMLSRQALEEEPFYPLAAGQLKQAIEAYRRIEGTSEIVKELLKEMIEYQKRAISQMGLIKKEVDISDIVKSVVEKVKGMPFNNK